MNKRRLLMCGAAVIFSASSAIAQDTFAEPPQGPAPTPPPGHRTPEGMKMRSPGPAFGTPTPMARPDLGKWWKNSEIAKEIGLTEQQINQIEQTFFDHRLKLIDLNAEVQRNEARLQPLMEADQLDEAKISAQMDQMLAARSRLEKANMMMMISIRKVLSVEQWKKLEEVREGRQRMFMKQPGHPGEQGPWERRVPHPPELPEGV